MVNKNDKVVNGAKFRSGKPESRSVYACLNMHWGPVG